MLDVIFNNIDHVTFVSSANPLNLKVLHVNDSYNTLGIRKEMIYKDPISIFKLIIHPNDKKNLLVLFYKSIRQKSIKEFEFRIIKPNDDKVYWMSGKMIPVLGKFGVISRMVGVVTDITERKNQEFKQANLYKVQGDVIKMLAHDLRSPISAIKITSEVLLSNLKKIDHQKKASQIISDCEDTLILMEDLLSYIQSDMESIHLNRVPLIVENSINEIIHLYRDNLIDKKITVSLPKTSTSFPLDPLRFHQIITNILSNAIKFTPDHGTIDIGLEIVDNKLTLSISDSGIGIPKELLPNLFEVFTNSRRIGVLGEKSTGLGLSITKKLIQLHGGEIHIISEENNGTTVKLNIPSK